MWAAARVHGQATCVAWHPAQEGVLGFGLDDGRVGVYRTPPAPRPGCHLFAGRHAGTVYELAWRRGGGIGEGSGGGSSGGAMEAYSLCSCGGDGAVLEWNPEVCVSNVKMGSERLPSYWGGG
jgi:hypothetical protein